MWWNCSSALWMARQCDVAARGAWSFSAFCKKAGPSLCSQAQRTGWDDDCCHRLARTVESALADEVTAAARAYDSGVHGICGNVAALACVIRFRFASHAEDHFPA
jgi:hypothetical protein